MGTTSVSIRDLDGPALDWAVAKVERKLNHITQAKTWAQLAKQRDGIPFTHRTYAPRRDYLDGMPILDREQVDTWCTDGVWYAAIGAVVQGIPGPTRLIAGLRVVVGKHLGPVVEVPSELLEV